MTKQHLLSKKKKNPHPHLFFGSFQVRLRDRRLTSAVSFLPVARSSATLDLFLTVTADGPIRDGRTEVVAMDLGVKDALFDLYLLSDARLLVVALGLIVLCVLAFTQSFFLTLLTGLTVVFSLGSAAFLYHFVLRVDFFPFMNVLAVVIAVGVGADDTFILVRCWSRQKADPSLSPSAQLERRLSATLRQCWLSMVVTSVTTAVAFFASFVSAVTAVRCFALFAGLAILCNLCLMLTWVPAGLAFYQRYCHSTCCCCLRSVTTAPDGTDLEHIDTCRWEQRCHRLVNHTPAVVCFDN